MCKIVVFAHAEGVPQFPLGGGAAHFRGAPRLKREYVYIFIVFSRVFMFLEIKAPRLLSPLGAKMNKIRGALR